MHFYRTKRLKSVQMIYFISLSISEALLNLMEVSQRIPEMLTHTKQFTTFLTYMQHYSILVNLSGIWLVLYLTMMYITIDRFCMVRYNFKYQVYWTKKKALYLINITWISSIFFTICIALGEAFLQLPYQEIFFRYFYPTIDSLYIILVISSYSYIFHRYQKSFKLQHKCSRKTIRRQRASSTQQAFSESKFYTSILLVLTFLLFIVIPDLTYMFFGTTNPHRAHNKRKNGYESSLLFDICRFSYAIASSIDFFIYVFPQQAVRVIIRAQSKTVKDFIEKKSGNKKSSEARLEYALELHMGVKRKMTQV